MKKIRVGIHGARGKMGRLLVQTLIQHPQCMLGAAIVSPNDPLIGMPIGTNSTDLCYTADFLPVLPTLDVIIDFSSPLSSVRLMKEAQKTQTPLLIGTTGFSTEQKDTIIAASKNMPLLWSANTSLGINALVSILPKLVAALCDFDIELLEIHHRHKKDAPSGTAQLLLESIRANKPELTMLSPRKNSDLKKQNEIGVASLRGGTVAGTHTIYFLGEGESVTITHEATSRQIFVDGALKAALWLISKPNGLYNMQDVLEIS